jgi:hypothetical protein
MHLPCSRGRRCREGIALPTGNGGSWWMGVPNLLQILLVREFWSYGIASRGAENSFLQARDLARTWTECRTVGDTELDSVTHFVDTDIFVVPSWLSESLN